MNNRTDVGTTEGVNDMKVRPVYHAPELVSLGMIQDLVQAAGAPKGGDGNDQVECSSS